MNNSFSLLFYVKKSKADTTGKANIYLRITLDGKRVELSIRRKILIENWMASSNMAKGNSQESQEINRYIVTIKNRIYILEQHLINKGLKVTATVLRDAYLGNDTNDKMLLEIFQDHNDKVEKLVGKDFAAGTLERYKTAKKHIANYIRQEYKAKDISVKDVDHKFITGFEYYLKTTRNCAHNSAIKYITNFKKIIRIAYANDWIDKDPFIHWKAKLKIVDREYLTEKELQTLVEKEFEIDRLNQVKDIFVFCCFTGLAYADVKKLAHKNIVLGVTGELWIKINRSKTDTRSNIPLLTIPLAILQKYTDSSDLSGTEHLLPVLSNQSCPK